MHTFYQDKSQQFECKLAITGASIDNTKVRLLVSLPENKVNLMYFGEVTAEGVCRVEVPPMTEMKPQNGRVSLEVITEGNYFEPWSSDCEVKASKAVRVESVSSVTEAPKPTVTASVEAPKPAVTASVQSAPKRVVESKPKVPVKPPPQKLPPQRTVPDLSSMIDAALGN